MTIVNMLAPFANENFQTSGGNLYVSDSFGMINNVTVAVNNNVSGSDLVDLLRSGCTIVSSGVIAGTPGVGVTAQETGDAYQRVTKLTLGPGCVLPAIAGGAALGVGTLLYTFPAGAQAIQASKMSVGITQTQGNINSNTPTVGLGTVIASGVVSVLSGTATFQNINVGKAATNCTGTATEQAAAPTGSPFSLVSDVGGVKALYFNVAATWNASGDAGALLSGTVSVAWLQLP
jgi:hypothetical protein